MSACPGISTSNTLFLNAMFKEMHAEAAAMTCGFLGDPFDAEGERKWKWKGVPWRRGTSTIFLRSITNNYLAISSFNREPESGCFKRRKAQFAQLHGLMIDDVGTKVPRRKIKLPLSALVETSPGNFQGWYFVDTNLDSFTFSTCDRLIKAMIRSGLTADGSDPGMNGVTRYGRLPVGVNAKAKYVKQLGHPFQCSLEAWNPERRYTIRAIANAYRLDVSAPATRPHPGARAARPVIVRSTMPLKLPKGEATKRVRDFEQMLHALAGADLYLESRGLWHEVICPWVHEHTDQKAGGSALCNPAESNAWLGGYRCHHGHCDGRTVGDVYRFAHSLKKRAA